MCIKKVNQIYLGSSDLDSFGIGCIGILSEIGRGSLALSLDFLPLDFAGGFGSWGFLGIPIICLYLNNHQITRGS
jgi:hypothetical protein